MWRRGKEGEFILFQMLPGLIIARQGVPEKTV